MIRDLLATAIRHEPAIAYIWASCFAVDAIVAWLAIRRTR